MTSPDFPDTEPTKLRDLPLPVRLVLAVFLMSVGVGYISALVQLHFKEASPGEILPTVEDVTRHYHGVPGQGQFEQLISESENRPWGAGGTMRPAFFKKSSGWKGCLTQTEKAFSVDSAAAEKKVRAIRELEIRVLLDWIHAGAKKETFDVPQEVPAKLVEPLANWKSQLDNRKAKEGEELPEPPEILFTPEDGKPGDARWTYNVSSIIAERCVRCHKIGGTEAQINLDGYEHVMDYIPPLDDPSARGVSLSKLAQSTHAHLLSFSMLYGLTGLLFACTAYPLWLRVGLAPLPLLAQVIDISFWWLARLDAPYGPLFASLIPVSGGIVGLGLLLQIVLGLFALFHRTGRIVLVVLIVAVAIKGHLFLKPIVARHLEQEKNPVTLPVVIQAQK